MSLSQFWKVPLLEEEESIYLAALHFEPPSLTVYENNSEK